jgi:hypothetical protein
MDRRTFLLALPAATLGVVACRDASGPADAEKPPEKPPEEPPREPPDYPTAADRALGVAAGLVARAEAVDGGVRWRVTGSTAYPTTLYDGQAGLLTFLAEAYRFRPDPDVRRVMEDGGRWLRAQPREGSRSLYEGSAGRAWAFLSLHEALGGHDAPWLAAALELAPDVAREPGGLIGDLINGTPGQGLFLLRLHIATGDDRWLDAAADLADAILDRAQPVGDGIKFPSIVLADGRTVFYTGLSHGAAGAGYFFCRLAELLPPARAGRYLDAAQAVAVWLADLAIHHEYGVNWYRREPDQMNTQQVQWCHGAPGIGIFFAEAHRVTGHADYLVMARECARTVDAIRLWNACQCHGLAGNAELFMKLHAVTGEEEWLEFARDFGDRAWTRRFLHSYYPAWPSGDGHNADNPGLMTGNAGIGWFYLQLATGGAVGTPITA